MLPQRGFAVGIDRWQQVYVSEGAEDIKSYRYCSTCKHWRGEQTSHCSACGYCVEEFDHHCGVLGCCIGRLNRRFFVSFLIFTAFAAILCAVQSGIALVELGDRWTVRKAALVLICVAAGYASTVIAFAAVHCVMFVMQFLLTSRAHVKLSRVPRYFWRSPISNLTVRPAVTIISTSGQWIVA